MGIAWRVALGLAGVVLLVGALVRFELSPWPSEVTASAFLRFTDTCLLAAILFLLVERLRPQQTTADQPLEEAPEAA